MTEFHVISCKDDGVGMDEETLQFLFDPFYSKKNKGRGLGLASVVGIVKGHGAAGSQSNRLSVLERSFGCMLTRILWRIRCLDR